MSNAEPPNAIGLVMEFLEAKKFSAAADALRKDLEAMNASLLPEAPRPQNPVVREFSKLESLLLRTKGDHPVVPISGSQIAPPSSAGSAEQPATTPEWHNPAMDPNDDDWTDDEALGYTKELYTEEMLAHNSGSESGTPSLRKRRNTPAVLTKAYPDDDEDDEDDDDDPLDVDEELETEESAHVAGGDLAGEEGDDESEVASVPIKSGAPASIAASVRDVAGVREGVGESEGTSMREAASATAAVGATEAVSPPSLDLRDPIFETYLNPSDRMADVTPAAAAGSPSATKKSGAPSVLPSGGKSRPTGEASARGEGVAHTPAPTVAVSLVTALDSGAEADADTEGGAVSTEDEAPHVPVAVPGGEVVVVASTEQRGEAPALTLASPPIGTASGPTNEELEIEEGEELGEEDLGEEGAQSEGEDETHSKGAAKEGAPDADEEPIVDEVGEEGEEEGEEDILESDPDVDPYERAEAEVGKYDTMYLKVVHERGRTGFEEHKDFPIRINSLIAARYQVKEYLGSAAFSKAVQCLDLHSGEMVCIKIIKNNKDFFDQSLDEIKLLAYLKHHDEADEHNIVHMLDFFYHKEHLFIVCELLRDNLYEFSRYNKESGGEPYFTLPRLRRIAKQCLDALVFTHKLKLIHCDLKPENILIKSYSRCEVKVIDFGSSCFCTDHLSSYVQSRSYRAPEVILGLPYNEKIDLWSLGAILAELFTGYVLFQNDSVPSMLARISGILGPFPPDMLLKGRLAHKYFVQGVVYEHDRTGNYQLLRPKVTSLRKRLHTDDELFLSFVGSLLRINPIDRPTAAQALQHPWLTTDPYGWPPVEGSAAAAAAPA